MESKLLKNTNFRVILGILVMGVMGGSIVSPILPGMIEPLNSSQENIGWVLTIYTFFALIFTPFLGSLADRIGRKKVLVPCIVLFGISGSAIYFASSFWIVLVLRAFQGIGVAAMMSLGVTLIGDLFKDKDRAKAMGYRTTAQGITNATMPFVAGAIATLGWFYPFLIYILAIPLAVITILKLNVPFNEKHPTLKKYFHSILATLEHRKTIWVFISNLGAFLLLYCVMIYLPIFITEKFSLSTFYTGLAVSFAAAMGGISASQVGRLAGKFEKHLLVLIGLFLCSISLFLFSFAGFYAILFLFLVLWGIGWGIVFPTLSTLATDLAPSHLRAGIVSGFSMMIYLGQTLSPPFFGWILKNGDLSLVFITGGFIGLILASYSAIEFFSRG